MSAKEIESQRARAETLSAKKHNLQRVTKVLSCEDCNAVLQKQHYLEPTDD